MAFKPKKAYIVSHTHWDREWYLTFHEFRVNLNAVIKKVLDVLENDPAFEHFLLDGQSVLLEDYFEIYPEDEDRIRNLTKAGKLSLGPWYMLPDEFIISAESHARNLLIGNKVSNKYGGAQKAGYMPDSFGHIAQMPQILRLGGLGSFVYTRGMGDEIDDTGFEYIWQAPDGSEVIAVNQCGGYCSAGALGFDDYWYAHTQRTVKPDRAVEQIGKLFERIGERSNGDIVLINNGCDHLPPQQEFGKILDALLKAFPETEFIHSNLADYFDAIEDAGFVTKKYSGEHIGGKLNVIIPGVWSTRVYLKQKNDECENLLSNNLEPLSSYSHFILGKEYPSGLIEYLWKLLMKNHPHDSICGCSIDEVHREMLPRFDGVIQAGEQQIKNQLMQLAPTFARESKDDKETTLCVFNPLPERRREVVCRLVVLQPFGIDPADLRLYDEQNNEIQFEIIMKQYVERFWGVDYRTMLDPVKQVEKFHGYTQIFRDRICKTEVEKDKSDCFIFIRFIADLPPVGHVLYRLVEKKSDGDAKRPMGGVTVAGLNIENEFYRVEMKDNGSFDIHCKKSDRWFRNLNILESTEDVGDEYDYSPCENTQTESTKYCRGYKTNGEGRGLNHSCTVLYNFELPVGISDDRKFRKKETKRCPVEITVGFEENSPVVHIQTVFTNEVDDHRLRAMFPCGIATDNVISDGHFYTNVRPIDKSSKDDWSQPMQPSYPQQDFTLLEDKSGGLAIFNRGLREFEAYRDENGGAGIALTLMRSVGWLSRDDFPTRKFSNAGPEVATPDAQCRGKQIFNYAVVPYEGNWIDAGIKKLSRRWKVPPLVIQGVGDGSISGGMGLVELISNTASITAIKKHDVRDTLVVRLYNLTGSDSMESLRFGRKVGNAWKVNLLEERIGELPVQGGVVELRLKPHEICSVEVTFL